MRVSQACQCCGLGLAMSGFTGFPAACNFYSARLGLNVTTDDQDWLVCSVDEITMYSSRPVAEQEAPAVRRFAYRINELDQRVEIELVFGVWAVQSGVFSFRLSEWTITYHVPFDDFDRLAGDGRLVLNEFVFTQVADPGLFFNSLQGLGEIVLVWPPFFEDWTGKQLTVQMNWARPGLLSTFEPPKYEIDLSFTQTPFVFMFDDSTLQETQTLGGFFSFYQDEHVGDGGNCFTFYRARQSNVLSGQVHVVELSYRSANVCQGRERRLRGNPSMFWAISGIWWKAFVEPPNADGQQVLTVVCDDRPHRRPSPLLVNSQLVFGTLTRAFSEMVQDWEEAFPVTVTLTLEDIDE